MKWAGHVAHFVEGEVYSGLWWENMRGRDHWRIPGVDWRIILNGFSRK
jgi:hypothetical protein